MYPLRDAKVVKEFNQIHQINVTINIAKGLKYLHHGCLNFILYGDLKPNNIIFNIFMKAMIIDFGIAKALINNKIMPNTSINITTNRYFA